MVVEWRGLFDKVELIDPAEQSLGRGVELADGGLAADGPLTRGGERILDDLDKDAGLGVLTEGDVEDLRRIDEGGDLFGC